MLGEKNSVNPITSIVSGASRHDPNDHAVALEAITSKAISIGEVGTTLTSDQKFFILQRLNYDGLVSLEDLPVGAIFMIEKIENLQVSEALEILRKTYDEFQDDFNYPEQDLDLIHRLINSPQADQSIKEGLAKATIDGELEKKSSLTHEMEVENSLEADAKDYHSIVDWDLQVRLEAAIVAYHSPYPEVRSVTDPYDDPSIPVETFRAYVIGVIWVGIGAVINQFFSMRQPNITMNAQVAQLFLYPCGQAWYYIFPDVTVPLGKYSFRLSPGPWTYKEQMFSTIIFSVFGTTQYVSYNIYTQKMPMFYDNKWAGWGYQILLALSNNFLGFGFAGILRKFACYPVKAIWPTVLPTLALNQALLKPERKENINGWTISRYYFFYIACAASFLYFWVPNYLFQALSTFNWMTWIKPDNLNLAAITGSVGGLGLNPISTFDINVILYNTPLVLPWFTMWNTYLGMIIAFPIICGLWYSNYKWTGYLPINSNGIFTNTGDSYDISQILNENGLFDQLLYDQYGPPFYTAANLVTYGAFCALYPFGIFYETIIRWRAMKESMISVKKTFTNWKGSVFDELEDPHSRMMSRYKEVPDWCYIVILVISFVFAVVCIEVYRETETPVWGIVFALAINLVFLIPLTALYSSTGFVFGLNVLVEMIIGYALPGNSQALMIIKAFGYNIDGQAQNYIGDQKMGHYAKIPPRALFRGQVLSVIVGTFISLGITNFQINGGVKDLCMPDNPQKFTCPDATTFFASSVLWGTIGPKRVFGGLYPVLQWCFLIGFLLVFPCVAIKWYAPKKISRNFQPSIIIGGMLGYAPYNLSYFTGGLYASFAFMYYIKNKYLTWWEKYNFVLYGALSSGIAFSGIIIFFAVQYHDKSIDWWGNNVLYAGMDAASPARLNATIDAPDGYFGPRIGNFP